jgi:hypothetical protein
MERGKRPQIVDLEARVPLRQFRTLGFRASSMVYGANPLMGAAERRITNYD